MKPYDRVVWWIKRDFRLSDNEALLKAMTDGQKVLAVFIFEPSILLSEDASFFHLHAQWQALNALSTSIQNRGGTLQIAHGEAVTVFEKLRSIDGFDALYSHQETGANISYQRDLQVASWCSKNKISWTEIPQNGVVRKLHSRAERQRIIKERLLDVLPKPAPTEINTWQSSCLEFAIPELEAIQVNESHCLREVSALQKVSEAHGLRECDRFLRLRGLGYSGGISSPNSSFKVGSRLSPHLAWGTVSLRTVFHESNRRLQELASINDRSTTQWKKSIRAFQSRLHWHDHFIQRLESAPDMEFGALNPAYRSIGYLDCPVILKAWSHGQTGIPLLDASMRCLMSTGFLNFRMRAMAVTTACFGLGQSWRSIRNPLAQVFLDYEPGIHMSQIQMQAGIVGINTLRVYNPQKQLIDQDPDCVFVKRWIPELREFEPTEIQAYETRVLGDYPSPVLDIMARGKFMKNQVYTIRKSEEGKEASAIVLDKHGSLRRSRTVRQKTTKKSSAKNIAAQTQMSFDL